MLPTCGDNSALKRCKPPTDAPAGSPVFIQSLALFMGNIHLLQKCFIFFRDADIPLMLAVIDSHFGDDWAQPAHSVARRSCDHEIIECPLAMVYCVGLRRCEILSLSCYLHTYTLHNVQWALLQQLLE